MKTKQTTRIVIATALLFMLFPVLSLAQDTTTTSTTGTFSYQLLEAIPGVFSAGATPDFNAYVSGIYKFLLLVVGICALFMITVGGYMYITSAGNTASMGKARSIIFDAIIGLILALLAYLIFYTINPNLTSPAGLQPISGISFYYGAISAGVAGKCDASVDTAIKNNSSGVDPKVLKAIIAGGEGCNPNNGNLSTACGYSQAVASTRAFCGISGNATESCKKIQNDIQLDINCAAKLIASNKNLGQNGVKCGSSPAATACCYYDGPKNSNCKGSGSGGCDDACYLRKFNNSYNTL